MPRREARLPGRSSNGPSCALVVLLTFGVPGFARAEVLAEADVIRLAATRDPESLAARREAELASARVPGPGLYPNPTLEWERQQISGSGPNAQSQDEVVLRVPVSLSGRRSARREMARSAASLSWSDASRARTRAVERALLAYQAAIAARGRVGSLRRAGERLDEAARVIARRVEEGTTSGYEGARIEIEAELLRSQLREAEARAEIARDELALLLGLAPAEVDVPSDFETLSPPPERLAQRPAELRSVTHAREAAEAAGHARRRARSASVPDVDLSGGLFLGTHEQTELGYSIGASVEVPLTSRGQDLRGEARAQRALAEARVAATERAAALLAMRARRELDLALSELARFEEAAAPRIELLERSVQTGYLEGRRTLLELVDIEQARVEVDERRLDLAFAAARASVALRAALGEFE